MALKRAHIIPFSFVLFDKGDGIKMAGYTKVSLSYFQYELCFLDRENRSHLLSYLISTYLMRFFAALTIPIVEECMINSKAFRLE